MLRVSLVALGCGALVALPIALVTRSGLGASELLLAGSSALTVAIDAVGWVLIPQLLLAVAILSLALQQLAVRLAGTSAVPTPGWLEPAVESALLLGLLGTMSGMVRGFVGVSPEELQPGPLVHSLGTALRSSLVGFGIALVGVWLKARPTTQEVEPSPEREGPRTSAAFRREAEVA